MHVVEQFESLLHESSMSHYLPDLERYLIDYPRAELPNAESVFYWENVKFGLKPTLRMNQMVIYRGSEPSGPLDSVAIKQLYGSHYFQTALDLSVCAKDSSQPDEKGFYLIRVKGSRQAGLTGPKGSIVQKSNFQNKLVARDFAHAHKRRIREQTISCGKPAKELRTFYKREWEVTGRRNQSKGQTTLKGEQSWHNL